MRIPIHTWLLLLASATVAAAQTPPSAPSPRAAALAITYTADRTNLVPGQSFWLQGGSANASFRIVRNLSVAASFTGLHASSISTTAVPLTLLTFTVGPRFTVPFHTARSTSLFTQVLFGTVHGYDSTFPSTNGATPSASGFALQAGGGINLALTRRTSFRLLEANWLRTQLPNGTTGVQNHLLLSTGLVLHF